MSAHVYARIAERYHVPASDDEAIERFFLDVAPRLSRDEREAIVAELLADDVAPGSGTTELPIDVPSFSIDEAPPVPRSSTLAQLAGELSVAVEERVLSRIELVMRSIPNPHSRLEHALVVAEVAESVRRAVSRMVEANVDVVAVYEQEQLVGILSDHDVLVRVVAEGLNPDDTSVADVMTRVH